MSVQRRKNSSVMTLAMAGMVAALIFVATYFLKIPIGNGYVHLGDAFILVGAALLGWAAVPAAAVGSMLADLLGGYTQYLIVTFVVKAAVAAVAVWGLRFEKLWLRAAMLVLAEAVMVAGYFFAEWLVLGYGLAAAVAAVPANIGQGLSGVILGLALIPLIGRVKPGAAR